MVLIKQHVSAYMEAIIRFFSMCWLQETINNTWLDVEISSFADRKHYIWASASSYVMFPVRKWWDLNIEPRIINR